MSFSVDLRAGAQESVAVRLRGEVPHAGAPGNAELAGDVEGFVSEDERPDYGAQFGWEGEEG